MKKMIVLFVMMFAVCGTHVLGADDKVLFPTDAVQENSAYIYPYSPTTIYRVYCRDDRLVDIALQPKEEFRGIFGADTVRWIIDQEISGSDNAKQWHVYIKPIKNTEDLSTTLNINTNLRIYHIEAYVSLKNFTPIIAWTYPLEEKLAILRAQEQEKSDEENRIFSNVSMTDVNFNYRITTKKGWAIFQAAYHWTPITVCDDGNKTYIKMPESISSSDAPGLFINDQGKLELVNYRVKKSYYIVDRVFDKAEMRNGKEIVVIERLKQREGER